MNYKNLNEAIISVVSPPSITNEEYIDILEETLIMIAEEEEEFCEEFTCYLPESVSNEETDEEYIEMLESVICDIAFENDCDAEDLLEITNRTNSLGKIVSAAKGDVKKHTDAAWFATRDAVGADDMMRSRDFKDHKEQEAKHETGKVKEAKAKIRRAENLKKTTGRAMTADERKKATELRQAHHKERAKGTKLKHRYSPALGKPSEAEYKSNVRWRAAGGKNRLDASMQDKEDMQKKIASKSPKTNPKYHGDLEETYGGILDKIDARSKRREDVFNRMAKPGNYGRSVAARAGKTEHTKQKRVEAVRGVAATKSGTPEGDKARKKAKALRRTHHDQRDVVTFERHSAASDNPARREAKTPGEKRSAKAGSEFTLPAGGRKHHPMPKFGKGTL